MTRLGAAAALLFAAVASAAAQGSAASALRDSISKLKGQPGFETAWRAGLETLTSIDEAVWLLGALGDASSGEDSRRLFLERARLLQLAGRYGEAALDWEKAASRSEPALLAQAAACRLATGDSASASRLAAAIASAWPGTSWESLASVISAWAEAQEGRTEGLAERIVPLLDHPDDRVAMCAYLFMRHAHQGEAAEKATKAAASRFPALLPALDTGLAPLMLSAALGAMGPGDAKASGKGSKPGDSATAQAGPSASSGQGSGPAQADPAAGSGESAPRRKTVFQVGAYRDEANAQAAAALLRKRGLSPIVSFAKDRGLHFVYVDAGSDPDRTVIAIKDAGFEAFRLELKQ